MLSALDNSCGELVEELQKLENKKQKLERDIEALMDVVQMSLRQTKGDLLEFSQGFENLVDNEGFPKSDIDVYAVRHARYQLCCLRTDYKDVCSAIEQRLHTLHAKAHQKKSVCQSKQTSMKNPVPKETSLTEVFTKRFSDTTALPESPGFYFLPFALVNEVFAGSPAETAGLLTGDLVIRLGDVGLQQTEGKPSEASISACFRALGSSAVVRCGCPLDVEVLRRKSLEPDSECENHSREEGNCDVQTCADPLSASELRGNVRSSLVRKRVTIIPQAWQGNGLLGCHLLPYSGNR